jgi:hypothetical protein
VTGQKLLADRTVQNLADLVRLHGRLAHVTSPVISVARLVLQSRFVILEQIDHGVA